MHKYSQYSDAVYTRTYNARMRPGDAAMWVSDDTGQTTTRYKAEVEVTATFLPFACTGNAAFVSRQSLSVHRSSRSLVSYTL